MDNPVNPYDIRTAAEQERTVGSKAEEHADNARDLIKTLPLNDLGAQAIAEALLAIEGRLNEITYRLFALEP